MKKGFREKPKRKGNAKTMMVGSRNGKVDAQDRPTTLLIPKQPSKLSRRAVRKFALTHSSKIGLQLISHAHKPKERALRPKEKRELRRREMERRAMAQDNVVMMDQIDAPRVDATKTEREILVLDQDDDAITLEGSIGLSSEPLGFVQRKID